MEKLRKHIILEQDAAYLKIPAERKMRVLSITKLMERYIDNCKPIPRAIYDKFWGEFINVLDEERVFNENVIKQRQNEILDHFSNDKDFSFNYERLEPNTDYVGLNGKTKKGLMTVYRYSLKEMINETVFKVLQKELDEGKLKRSTFIDTVFHNLKKYRSQLTEEQQEFITHYKITVITGLITLKHNFPLTKDITKYALGDATPTNMQIYQAIKYHTKKLK